MIMTIQRAYKKPHYTIGRVYIDGKYFCNSLEDTDRGFDSSTPLQVINQLKVFANTAIPSGDYTVKMTHSPRFKRLMAEVMFVRGFTGVRIHAGNTAEDTKGCILLGDNTKVGMLTNSRKRVQEFEQLLKRNGNQCLLHIE